MAARKWFTAALVLAVAAGLAVATPALAQAIDPAIDGGGPGAKASTLKAPFDHGAEPGGSPIDWEGLDPVIQDAHGDESDDHDIWDVYLNYDSDYIYFRVVLGGSGDTNVLIDMDVDQNTGTGCDAPGWSCEHSMGVEYSVYCYAGSPIELWEWDDACDDTEVQCVDCGWSKDGTVIEAYIDRDLISGAFPYSLAVETYFGGGKDAAPCPGHGDMPLPIESCDSSGNPKQNFAAGETVYAKGSALAADTSYKLWVQDNPVGEGDTLVVGEDPSGAQEEVTTDGGGKFAVTAIWTVSDGEPAHYDIVADNQDSGTVGTYNANDDAIDAATTAGIAAPIPELPAILLLGAGLAVLGLYIWRRGRSSTSQKPAT